MWNKTRLIECTTKYWVADGLKSPHVKLAAAIQSHGIVIILCLVCIFKYCVQDFPKSNTVSLEAQTLFIIVLAYNIMVLVWP